MNPFRRLWNRRPWRPKLRLGDDGFWIPPNAGLDWKEITLAQLASDSNGNFMLPWRDPGPCECILHNLSRELGGSRSGDSGNK